MAIVTLAATQMACSWDLDDNIQKAEEQVTAAAEDGAQIILLQELFQTPYFCIEKNYGFQRYARPWTLIARSSTSRPLRGSWVSCCRSAITRRLVTPSSTRWP